MWQKAQHLVSTVYEKTSALPSSELYGLAGQARRAAVSIAANIAEGAAMRGGRNQSRFYRIALASARELETHVAICVAVGFLNVDDVAILNEEVDEVERMLFALIRQRMGSVSPPNS